MNQLKIIFLIALGGAAAFFIISLAYRAVARQSHWYMRLVWPYCIIEALRYHRGGSTAKWRWITMVNMAVLASIAGLVLSVEVAQIFPQHVFTGYEIHVGYFKTWFVSCEHDWHNVILWIVRYMTLITALNLFTKIFMSWEDVRRQLRKAFKENGFLEKGEAKIELISPYTYLFKGALPFAIKHIFERLDALQRSAGVFFLGIGNAPPSGIIIMASKNGLPIEGMHLSDLPAAQSLTKVAVGLAPLPVWMDIAEKPQTGVVGPTGAGKSTLGRTIAAQLNLANPDTVNIFIDIRGVDYADVGRSFNSGIDRAGKTWAQFRQECKRIRNVIMIRDLDILQRVMTLLDDEVSRRERFLLQNGLTNITQAMDDKFWQNPVKVTRILIFWDGFSIAFRRYGGNAKFKDAADKFFTVVTDGRKYGVHSIVLTTRASFDQLEEARDEFNWFGVGDFRERAGKMIFEQSISGENRRGAFIYQLPRPYIGLGYAMGIDTPLTLTNQSLVAALTRSSAAASEACLKLGDHFNTQLHRVQHDEELEKVHEATEKYLAIPR